MNLRTVDDSIYFIDKNYVPQLPNIKKKDGNEGLVRRYVQPIDPTQPYMNEQNLKAFFNKNGFLPDSQGSMAQHQKYPFKAIITTDVNIDKYIHDIDCEQGVQRFSANKGIDRPKIFFMNEDDCIIMKKRMVDDGISEDDILYSKRNLPENSPFEGGGLPPDTNLSEIFCVYRIPFNE